jgi:signal transduction histidine kinase
MGFAEILRAMDQGDYEEERDGLLAIISSQAADLSDLVEDLLTNTRSELGQLEVVSVPVNIHAQLAQVQEARPSTDKPLSLPDRPDTPVTAVGDPQRVRQILRNLVTNANRYGGAEIVVKVESSSDWITVSVRDNGEGISAEAEDRLFDRYYRDVNRPAHPGSIGLGLTIARDLALRMGGELVYRRQDGWTSFELSLPRG